ncbi:LIC_10421 family protein [Leptospira sp. GIMC2001]|uniref:LIC_10421 family protein n=1 Tax=Leptospira sp. GIMC2001 TaxID=1513297 RepID=UPI00234B5FBF|nr:hypothetical protein [Leptospira sp. GIMC2001]WCL49184.1 hypothetical protein O4O04_18110 [Leptospira sp. GIMC2001]
MKNLIKTTIATIVALGLSFTSLSAIDQSTKLKMMEEAIVESAATPAQKSVVSNYMNNVAKEKLELAQSLRDRANSPKAGKVAYKNAEKRDLLKKAARLEAEAKNYQNF